MGINSISPQCFVNGVSCQPEVHFQSKSEPPSISFAKNEPWQCFGGNSGNPFLFVNRCLVNKRVIFLPKLETPNIFWMWQNSTSKAQNDLLEAWLCVVDIWGSNFFVEGYLMKVISNSKEDSNTFFNWKISNCKGQNGLSRPWQCFLANFWVQFFL